MISDEAYVDFREVQQFRQPWLWIVMLSSPVIAIAILWTTMGKNPGEIAALHGALLAIVITDLALAAGFYFIQLITEVRSEGLYIRFVPFVRQLIPYGDIKTCEARTYSPIGEYGGWGMRWGRSGKAYNISGNRGVQLEFKDGKRLLIGSQRAEELAQAIQARMK